MTTEHLPRILNGYFETVRLNTNVSDVNKLVSYMLSLEGDSSNDIDNTSVTLAMADQLNLNDGQVILALTLSLLKARDKQIMDELLKRIRR